MLYYKLHHSTASQFQNSYSSQPTSQLQAFYSAPSADFATNFRWPTHAFRRQLSDQQPPDQLEDNEEEEAAAAQSNGGSTRAITRGGTKQRLSVPQRRDRDVFSDWSASSGQSGQNSSTRPFHTFRGKKAHQIVSVRDCFIPPRHLFEPISNHGLVPVEVLPSSASGLDNKGLYCWPAAGITKAVHLPPILETPRDGQPVALKGGATAVRGKNDFALSRPPLRLKPGAPGQPLIPSFQRKFAVCDKIWSQEAEAGAEERVLHEQWREKELLRHRLESGGGGRGEGRGYNRSDNNAGLSPGGFSRGPEGFQRTGRRRRRDLHGSDFSDEGVVVELIPEKEEALLTQLFDLLDARDRGEVRLDEVLFHMMENAQVRVGGRKTFRSTCL